MKRVVLTAILLGALASISGCASIHSTRAVATPWGVAGVHSFRPEEPRPTLRARAVDAQVGKVLDEHVPDYVLRKTPSI
jgi:hypothetical protein